MEPIQQTSEANETAFDSDSSERYGIPSDLMYRLRGASSKRVSP